MKEGDALCLPTEEQDRALGTALSLPALQRKAEVAPSLSRVEKWQEQQTHKKTYLYASFVSVFLDSNKLSMKNF